MRVWVGTLFLASEAVIRDSGEVAGQRIGSLNFPTPGGANSVLPISEYTSLSASVLDTPAQISHTRKEINKNERVLKAKLIDVSC